MLYYHVDSIDPAYNLALEEQLVNDMVPGHPGWFLLWRNKPSIIVGRHQNTLEEINSAQVEALNIPVLRRGTGGGAVYHDLGNVNFSFISSVSNTQDTSFAYFLTPILQALQELGLNAEFSSRNDITVDGHKVSGSAQMRRGSTLLHHGTLLYNLDMNVLSQVLAGNPDKYQSKGVPSHRSRVANLKNMLPTHINLENILTSLAHHCSTENASLPPNCLDQIEKLANDKYRSWNWNYGKSPKFTTKKRERFPWGSVECCLEIQNGTIQNCRIFGDFFAHQNINLLEAKLNGIKYHPISMTACLKKQNLIQFFVGSNHTTMLNFLASV